MLAEKQRHPDKNTQPCLTWLLPICSSIKLSIWYQVYSIHQVSGIQLWEEGHTRVGLRVNSPCWASKSRGMLSSVIWYHVLLTSGIRYQVLLTSGIKDQVLLTSGIEYSIHQVSSIEYSGLTSGIEYFSHPVSSTPYIRCRVLHTSGIRYSTLRRRPHRVSLALASKPAGKLTRTWRVLTRDCCCPHPASSGMAAELILFDSGVGRSCVGELWSR